MSIKANEIRIGNFVKLQGVDKPFKVFVIDTTESSTFTKAEPIPLTEEWLIKFGWLWNEECNSYECKDIRMNLAYKDVNCGYEMFNYVTKSLITKRIFYVNQLQNLYFALTGEELILDHNEVR